MMILEYNYNNQITLYFNKFFHKKGDYFATSNGLGKNKVLDETSATRKNVNNLIEYTSILNDEKLIQINNETDVVISPILYQVKNFRSKGIYSPFKFY